MYVNFFNEKNEFVKNGNEEKINNRTENKMDSENSNSNSSMGRRQPHQNLRILSSESESNHSDASANLMQVDFDALKNDSISISTHGDVDPLSLPTNENPAQIQTNDVDEEENDEKNDSENDVQIRNDCVNDENSNSHSVQNRSDIDSENAEKNVLNNVHQIKLVPLESLLQKNEQKTTNSKCQSIDISSDSSSDQPLASIISTKPKSSPKKRFTKKRHRSRNINNSSNESNSDESTSSPERQRLKRKSKAKNKTYRSEQDILSVKVRLNKLPWNLEPLLKRYNLSEIRDRHQNILFSREKTHRNTEKKSKSKSSTKRILNDGSSDATDDSVVKLNRNQAKKQKLSDNSEPTTSKRSKHSAKQTKRSHRIKNQKPLRYHISSESDEHNDTDNNNDDDDSTKGDKRKMRKKNVPKSSTDVTDSNGGSNSDDDIEENKSSESEEEVRTKRKRQVVVKKSSNDDDDDDDDYPKPAKHRRRKRIRKIVDSSEDDGDQDSPKKHGRKNIRKVIRSSDLEVETKEAAKREAERKKRIEERQKLYNEMYDNKLEEITELDKLVLDFDPETKEELITVDKKLVKKLKPHQGQGVKFMWDACFESIEKINENHGGGCILAHCMGLGKTLQVVTLVHTLLTHSEDTGVEKVLIICPVSTVLNWVNEFKIWLRHCSQNRNIEIFEISKYKQNLERANRINEWHKDGGVLILGYDMFRNLSTESTRIRKKQRDIFQEGLVDPGPDLVVCDEGHLLKNSKTSLSKAVNRIRSLRRIVLTGTPLQNNLNEYYCMVQFVKPNLLGKYNEYLNRFVNPITNGQYTDSTPYDIQMMKRRSHILHKLLDGCVQRRDYSVLAPFLPPKQEYVLYIRLTKLQVDLYKYYMANRPAQSEYGKTRSSVLFQDFQNLQRIWTHPRVLRYNSDRYEQMAQKKKFMASDDEEEGSLKDFIDDTDDDDDSEMDNSSSDSSSSSSSSNDSSVQSVRSDKPSNSKKSAQSRRTRANAKDFDPEPIEPIKEENPTEWWMPLCPEDELNNMEYSGKLMLLFSILAECEACGDKLLVFSQSLFSLDVIEHFLTMIDDNTQNPNPDVKLGGFTGSWVRGLDYFRLDGSTNIETRNANCISFNSEANPQARLFLISTRAGGLGINLVAANRVIIFDASWNPSHDIQSIFRVYRFGQKKPCYIYRFIALGTMEEKIYERQVTKLAISKRVIDEHQIDRHYKENDLNELYNIENIDPEGDPIRPKLPKDRLFAEQLHKYPDRIWKFHEHDSLLENKSEETLSKEEIEAAWKEFEEEKNRPTVQQQTFVGYPAYQRAPGTGPVTSNNIFGFRTDILLQLLNIKARRAYPGTQNISEIVPMLLKHLYETMEKNDTSFYQELLFIQQTEMAAPSQGSYLTPAGHIMPAYSGRGRPPLNPQNSTVHIQQQHLIQQAQNRLMNINNGNPRLPAPTVSPHVIEID